MPPTGPREGFAKLTIPCGSGRFAWGAAAFQEALAKLTGLTRINRVYAQAATALDQWEFLRALLKVLQVDSEVAPGDLTRLPAQGPVVVVANHPFGGIEGIILPELLGRRRRDIKVLANYLLKPVVELRDMFIYVDPFGTTASPGASLAGLRQALAWLRQGGVLVVFPAGEVSHLHWSSRTVTDPIWSPTVAWLLRQSGSAALPAFFAGHNGMFFQALGLIHPLLRTVLLPREALNKSGKTIQVKFGQVIQPETLAGLGGDAAVMTHLRLRTYMLQGHFGAQPAPSRLVPRSRRRPKPRQERVAAPVPAWQLAQEVNLLPPAQLLLTSGGQKVYYAQARQIPHLLQEIGRLREITFRGVGEGTGRGIDLDRFDAHYLHLFVWNEATAEVVGAYRLGRTDRLLVDQGQAGLYTATLFDFAQEFWQQLPPALELGRSFVRPEYQKNYTALLLLWQGIGRYLAQRPYYHYLFGPVSISNAYNEFSQGLLATWLSLHTFLPELAQYLRPKNPWRVPPSRHQQLRLALAGTQAVEDLSALLADVDPQRRGVPVLLRQYLKLGGKILGFNRDPDFSNALDGLILVDLLQTSPAVLQRYMGKPGWAAFARWHGQIDAPPPKSPRGAANQPRI